MWLHRAAVLLPVLSVAAIAAPPARAGECTGSDAFQRLIELTFPTYTGGGVGFDQPFANVFHWNLSFSQSNGCGGPCPANSFPGEGECGNLVSEPLDVHQLIAGFETQGDLSEFNSYEARLLPDGIWEYRSEAIVFSPGAPNVRTAYSNVVFGHREVFDVTSTATGLQPLTLRLRDSGIETARPQSCPGISLPQVGVTRTFRVRSAGASPILDLILGPPDSTFSIDAGPDYDRVVRDWNFLLQIPPNTTLFVDLMYQAAGDFQAPLTDPITGQTCDLAIARSQWLLPNGGIQLFVSPGPASTAVARSGISYAPVPEPGMALSLAAGAFLLAALLQGDRLSRCSALGEAS